MRSNCFFVRCIFSALIRGLGRPQQAILCELTAVNLRIMCAVCLLRTPLAGYNAEFGLKINKIMIYKWKAFNRF